ncbi:MAG: lysophospholipid acyltransferase family protein [Proteobacteria bacterium]|nr:lysophospholipid acyltransferase family protein [Pseudomonadota bacterium]
MRSLGVTKIIRHGVAKRCIRYPMEALLLGIFFGVFRALPIEVASAFGGFIGRVIGPRLSTTTRAIRNLGLVFPEKTNEEYTDIVVGMWDNLGRNAAEFPHLKEIVTSGDDHVEVVNGELLTALTRNGQSAILVGAHLANWEISSALERFTDMKIISVVRKQNNPLTQKMIEHFRRSVGGKQIDKGRHGAKEILSALRSGTVIGLLFDQKMNDGAPISLFGREAMTPIAPAQMALSVSCAIIPVRVERTGGVRFRITIYPPVEFAGTGHRHADAKAIKGALNERLEEWVRERPEQWMWLHRRWAEETYVEAGL